MGTKNILVITLSNIGDVVLTFPVINSLIETYPDSRLSVMAGPNARELFEKDARILRFIEYDKSAPFRKKISLIRSLLKAHYDVVIDLRNSIFPLFLGNLRLNNLRRPPRSITHMRDKHMWRAGLKASESNVCQIYIPDEDKAYIDTMIEKWGIKDTDRVVVVAPGAKSHAKRWTLNGFANLCDRLKTELDTKVVIVGDGEDKDFVKGIICKMKNPCVNAAGLTNLRQLVYIIKYAKVLVSNDSSPVHIAGCVGTSSVALFGPTDPKKYGPVGRDDIVIQKDGFKCMPCEEPLCRLNPQYPEEALCMKSIDAEEVFNAVKTILL